MVVKTPLEQTDMDLEEQIRNADAKQLKRLIDHAWESIKKYNLYAGVPRSQHTERALSLAQQILDIAGTSGDLTLFAEASAMMAYALNANEEYARALPFYTQGLEALERLGEKATAARRRLGLMVVLANLGKCDEAIQVGAEADKWFLSSGDEAGHARLCSNLASVYMRQDEHGLAFRYQSEALEYFKKTGDEKALAQTHLNAGNALSNLDRFEESNLHYEQCREIATRLGLDDLSAHARYNRTYLSFLRGRYSEALSGYNEMRALYQKKQSGRHSALCDLDEAEVYLMLGLSHEAVELALKAADAFQKLDMKYERAKAMAFTAIGRTQARQFGMTLETLCESQQLFRESGNLYWIALIDLCRAHVLFSLGRFWEAQSLGMSAKDGFEKLTLSTELLASLILLGYVAVETRNWNEAQRWSEEAQRVAARSGKTGLRAAACSLSAQLAEKLEDRQKACEYYELAAKEIETRRVYRRDDHIPMLLSFCNQDIYESLVTLALESTDVGRVYELCEKAKSKSLVDRLSPHFQAIRGKADQSVLSRVNRLRDELNSHYLRNKKESDSHDTPAARIEIKEQELIGSLREVSAVDPEYVSLQTISVPSLQSVQASIPDDTTILEFFVARNEVMALVLSPDRASVVRRLCPVGRIHYLEEKLRKSLNRVANADETKAPSERNLQETNRYLKDLHSELLAPLTNLLTTSRLTIVPHGILHFLPFHAFLEKNEYLIDRFEISYSPSSTALHYCLGRARIEDASPLIAVGDVESPGNEWEELKNMSPHSRILDGNEFSRGRFIKEAASADFIHLAADFYLRQDSSMFSGFKLRESSISALDLYSLPVGTNLLMITGEIFGVNHAAYAEDWLAVTRGILYAGVRSVIVGLWKPAPKATRQFSARFYRAWNAGESKSHAFRMAMLAVRDSFPHPYFWARYVLIGSPR
jgi:CHAT domain-containing protein/tetratricopeptide (TPR) repeat protein